MVQQVQHKKRKKKSSLFLSIYIQNKKVLRASISEGTKSIIISLRAKDNCLNLLGKLRIIIYAMTGLSFRRIFLKTVGGGIENFEEFKF